MRAPKIPSFFKIQNLKSFSFSPRYYNEKKERHEQLLQGRKANIKFHRKHSKKASKGRYIRMIILIIILSLLTYKIIIN